MSSRDIKRFSTNIVRYGYRDYTENEKEPVLSGGDIDSTK